LCDFVTRGFAEWFGTSREEIVGRRLADLYGPEAYSQFAPSLKRAFAGEDVHYERQAVDSDGKSYWISVNLRPHRTNRAR
jgi:PAS domain S-box-containing protein